MSPAPPRWISDLERLLPIRSQFVVSGNIRDSFLVEMGGAQALVSLMRSLMQFVFRIAILLVFVGIPLSAVATEAEWVEQSAISSRHAFFVFFNKVGNERHPANVIRIVDRKTGTIVQEINSIGGLGPWPDAANFLSLRDANFDGNPDIIHAFADAGAEPNNRNRYYLFNPKTERFEFNEALSKISQVLINPNGTITSASQDGCCQLSLGTYRFINGKLTLIANWTESYTADGKWIVTTAGALKNGKMRYRVTKRSQTQNADPKIPVRFRGIWGVSHYACQNAGDQIIVRGDIIVDTGWDSGFTLKRVLKSERRNFVGLYDYGEGGIVEPDKIISLRLLAGRRLFFHNRSWVYCRRYETGQ